MAMLTAVLAILAVVLLAFLAGIKLERRRIAAMMGHTAGIKLNLGSPPLGEVRVMLWERGAAVMDSRAPGSDVSDRTLLNMAVGAIERRLNEPD